MDRVIFQRLFPKSNVARGNWTSPVLPSCSTRYLLLISKIEECAFINIHISTFFKHLTINILYLKSS